MSKIIEAKIKEVKDILDKNKTLKTIVYVSVGLIIVYQLSKSFSSLTNTLKSVNQLNSLLNGK